MSGTSSTKRLTICIIYFTFCYVKYILQISYNFVLLRAAGSDKKRAFDFHRKPLHNGFVHNLLTVVGTLSQYLSCHLFSLFQGEFRVFAYKKLSETFYRPLFSLLYPLLYSFVNQ